MHWGFAFVHCRPINLSVVSGCERLEHATSTRHYRIALMNLTRRTHLGVVQIQISVVFSKASHVFRIEIVHISEKRIDRAI